MDHQPKTVAFVAIPALLSGSLFLSGPIHAQAPQEYVGSELPSKYIPFSKYEIDQDHLALGAAQNPTIAYLEMLAARDKYVAPAGQDTQAVAMFNQDATPMGLGFVSEGTPPTTNPLGPKAVPLNSLDSLAVNAMQADLALTVAHKDDKHFAEMVRDLLTQRGENMSQVPIFFEDLSDNGNCAEHPAVAAVEPIYSDKDGYGKYLGRALIINRNYWFNSTCKGTTDIRWFTFAFLHEQEHLDRLQSDIALARKITVQANNMAYEGGKAGMAAIPSKLLDTLGFDEEGNLPPKVDSAMNLIHSIATWLITHPITLAPPSQQTSWSAVVISGEAMSVNPLATILEPSIIKKLATATSGPVQDKLIQFSMSVHDAANSEALKESLGRILDAIGAQDEIDAESYAMKAYHDDYQNAYGPVHRCLNYQDENRGRLNNDLEEMTSTERTLVLQALTSPGLPSSQPSRGNPDFSNERLF